ncbi:MAG: hypothetical protein WCJ45_04345 [bacterium]
MRNLYKNSIGGKNTGETKSCEYNSMNKIFYHNKEKNKIYYIVNELIVIELIRLIIPRLISAKSIPITIKVIFFFASLTSPHFADSIIHIIALKITIVTERTIVILKRNFVILTMSGA